MASAPPNPTARLSRESGFLQCGAPHPASGARRHQGPARPRIARVCRRQTNKRRRAPTPRARRPAASQGSGRSFWPDRHRTPATSRPRAFMSTVPTFRDLRRSIGAAHVGLHTPVDWCWPQRVAPPCVAPWWSSVSCRFRRKHHALRVVCGDPRSHVALPPHQAFIGRVLRDSHRQAASTGPSGAGWAGGVSACGTPGSRVAPVTRASGADEFSIRQRSTLP